MSSVHTPQSPGRKTVWIPHQGPEPSVARGAFRGGVRLHSFDPPPTPRDQVTYKFSRVGARPWPPANLVQTSWNVSGTMEIVDCVATASRTGSTCIALQPTELVSLKHIYEARNPKCPHWCNNVVRCHITHKDSEMLHSAVSAWSRPGSQRMPRALCPCAPSAGTKNQRMTQSV